ncbi:hypothetical protein TRIUR3_27895 [Triticum urartu]|uniref:Uncharacterized protein n=1 Tax=Triticum urartu TaxID=4572 RepID=M8ARZ5_TRIUA|nr:hypothetical protein TRIUR3_27895 [Triticum urartu]
MKTRGPTPCPRGWGAPPLGRAPYLVGPLDALRRQHQLYIFAFEEKKIREKKSSRFTIRSRRKALKPLEEGSDGGEGEVEVGASATPTAPAPASGGATGEKAAKAKGKAHTPKAKNGEKEQMLLHYICKEILLLVTLLLVAGWCALISVPAGEGGHTANAANALGTGADGDAGAAPRFFLASRSPTDGDAGTTAGLRWMDG